MFRITKSQMAIFATTLAADFIGRVKKHIEAEHPEHGLDEATLHRHILLGMERAKKWGFCSEPAVCAYIDAMFSLGIDFDSQARFYWARSVLEESDTDWERAERLLNKVADYVEFDLPHADLSAKGTP